MASRLAVSGRQMHTRTRTSVPVSAASLRNRASVNFDRIGRMFQRQRVRNDMWNEQDDAQIETLAQVARRRQCQPRARVGRRDDTEALSALVVARTAQASVGKQSRPNDGHSAHEITIESAA